MEISPMQPVTLNHTELLTRQGIAALQGNDTTRAYELLGQAVHIAPQNEQAWLWLSGAVPSDAERRYCLERVLVLNPQNTAAQHGMARLSPSLPISPFPDHAPRAPSTPAPPLICADPATARTRRTPLPGRKSA
jgi:hypothetical protein